MDFTREPIIETVISPREGCKLVVRSSKSTGQEEYFVDALEVVSFGHSFFFRSLERPKSFLVPATDYEVLEVREPRMALKNVGLDRKIKIAGGRESSRPREVRPEPREARSEQPREARSEVKEEKEEQKDARAGDNRRDRDRKRGARRRRGRGDRLDEQVVSPSETAETAEALPETKVVMEGIRTTTSMIAALLPPPPTLISEQIQKYKQDDMYKDAFFTEKPKSVDVAIEQEVVVSEESEDSTS